MIETAPFAAGTAIHERPHSLHLVLSLAARTSVIVVAYNSGACLRACVASIFRTEPDVEIVVVDNASTDDAVARLAAEFPSVRTVQRRENGGFGAGNNTGAAAATGDFLAFINPDAVVTDGWLEALVGPLATDASLGLVTPKVLLCADPGRINVAGLNVHLSGIATCRGLQASRSAFDQTEEVAAVSGSAFAVRREVFERVGGFDEDLFLYFEDVDLSARVWLAGYRCLYVPRAVVLHDYDRVRVDTRKAFRVEMGRYLMLLKAFEWRTLLALLPTLLLAEVVTGGWLLVSNPAGLLQKPAAWRWLLTHRAHIAAKRRQVRAYRAAPDSAFLAHCGWQMDFGQLASPMIAQLAKIALTPLFYAGAWISLIGSRG
ncbi:MAG: glycosyltransferase family 2 protein [Anaerolineales bacterium]|nr:glycosyltransferase family 2 protein [Anaerolineales bacterium]